MKIFLDSANLDELKKAAAWGIIDGVTTNPSLIAREGVAIEEQIAKICEIVDGDISAEVVAIVANEMISEGLKLSKIHKNIVVKVPLTRDGIQACKTLATEGIRTNVTLCFPAAQAMLAAKAGAYIISPFVGRLDDIGMVGVELIESIRTIYDNYGFTTKILAASLRSPLHIVQCAEIGADIGTMPFKTMDMLFNHPLTNQGLEQFLKDHAKAFEGK